MKTKITVGCLVVHQNRNLYKNNTIGIILELMSDASMCKVHWITGKASTCEMTYGIGIGLHSTSMLEIIS